MMASMSENVLDSSRRFQVWKYTAGHAMLLLRSVKEVHEPTRIDVLFVDVTRIDMPTTLDGLRIDRTGDHFRLTGSDWSGSVEASNVAIAEDHGEYSDPSPFAEGSGI